MKVRVWGPLFALIALLAAGLAGVGLQYVEHSNQCQPAKSENGNCPDRKAATVTTPKPDDTKTDIKQDRQEGLRITDWLLVLFNGLLALYTWRLYKATSGLVDAAGEQSKDMKASIKAAEAAALAAQKSADVSEAGLIVAERPYLIHREPKLKIYRFGHPGMPPSEPPEWCVLLEYGLTNSGRSIALIKEITAELLFVRELPTIPKYSDDGVRTLNGHYPVEVGKPYLCPTYRTKDTIKPATFAGLTTGDLKPFFFGYVRYADIFGYLHTEGFCFRFLKIGDGANIQSICAMLGGPAYNYSRSEKIPPQGIEGLQTHGAELTADDIARFNSAAKEA